MEKAILDISAREQRRIGQDLHDGLGQHLTGIAFMAKVHEAKLAEQSRMETEDAAKIVKLVNEAIHKTRELARGLLPVVSDSHGLMSALQLWAAEVQDLFGVSCRFQCETPVLIHDDAMAEKLGFRAVGGWGLGDVARMLGIIYTLFGTATVFFGVVAEV